MLHASNILQYFSYIDIRTRTENEPSTLELEQS